MRRVLLPTLIAAALLAPLAHGATAQPTFGLRAAGNPKIGYFVYSAGAGTTQHGAVIVSNSGTAAGVVKLTTAVASTGATSGTIYLTETAPRGSATWIKLAKTSLTLQPKTALRVPFTVAVPAGTAAGQYVAGIVAAGANHPTGSSGGKTSVRIKIRNLAIMAVQVNVPGPVTHHFAIGTITAGGAHGFQQVLVAISNQGNVLEHPHGTVTIFDSTGARVESIPYQMDTFLPRTSITYPVTLRKALPAGSYTASVDIAYGGGKSTSAKPAFQVSKENVQQVFTSTSPTQAPPTSPSGSSGGSSSLLYIVIAAVAALLLGAVAFLLLRRRRPAPPAAPPPAPAAPPPACDPYHHWVPDYDAAVTGPDGVTRFPHRCRDCGLQVVAKDVSEATEFAKAIQRP